MFKVKIVKADKTFYPISSKKKLSVEMQEAKRIQQANAELLASLSK